MNRSHCQRFFHFFDIESKQIYETSVIFNFIELDTVTTRAKKENCELSSSFPHLRFHWLYGNFSFIFIFRSGAEREPKACNRYSKLKSTAEASTRSRCSHNNLIFSWIIFYKEEILSRFHATGEREMGETWYQISNRARTQHLRDWRKEELAG